MTTFAETDDFLAHYGVKGMRWGVRRENRIQSLERVGAGTASKGEKARYALTEATGVGMRRNGGLAGSAANKAANMRAVDARRARGEGTVADFLKVHGGDRFVDTGRVDRDLRPAGDNSKPRQLTDRQKNALKIAGVTAAAAAGGTAAYVIGKNSGVKMTTVYNAKERELAKSILDKSLTDMFRDRTLDSMGYEMAKYVVNDTFNNRMGPNRIYPPGYNGKRR
jgi:hypothetical protein